MRSRYGWMVVLVSAAAMVGSLPGRTQGLGLVTEPLLADLGIDRVSYAALNFWATLIGSAGALGVGYAVDRLGARVVITAVLLALGAVVCFMSQADGYTSLAVWITLTRALGQSALSVVSLAIVGFWFVRRIDTAMAVYSVAISIGFMAAFPLVGYSVQAWGWRDDLARRRRRHRGRRSRRSPFAVVRRNPESVGLLPDAGKAARDGVTDGDDQRVPRGRCAATRGRRRSRCRRSGSSRSAPRSTGSSRRASGCSTSRSSRNAASAPRSTTRRSPSPR